MRIDDDLQRDVSNIAIEEAMARQKQDEPVTTQPDGFRPRRKRDRGWLKAAIKDGSVRDPNGPPDEHIDYSGTGATVVSVPVAALDGEGT